MKKIGIVTWHYLENYGSALQAYAMQKNIEKLGCQPEIINYRANAKKGIIYNFLRTVKYNLIYPKNTYKNRKKNFYNFRKKFFNESQLYSTNEELIKKATNYDIYICGSDQIWAPNRIDLPYLLNFVSNDKQRVSYAPSIVFDGFSQEQQELLKKELIKFKHLSLREPYGVEIIKKITGIDAVDVLDPTLLLEKNDYKLLIKETKVDKPYILCYLIGDNRKHREMVMKIKELYGFNVLTLPFKDFDDDFGDIQIRDAGPSEFLDLIDNASIICTDSFHGVLFSIIFEKQFYVFNRFSNNDKVNQNARIANITQKLDLESRVVTDINNIDINTKIDYSLVNKKLHIEKEKSIEFLRKSLM